MHLVYSAAQLAAQAAALSPLFDRVAVMDADGTRLDPTTLAPAAQPAPLPVPALDASGRGWLPVAEGDNVTLYFCQAVQVEGRALVLAAGYTLPCGAAPAAGREANAFQRMLYRYLDEMRRDYVTGAYNHRYLTEEFAPAAALRAADAPVSVAVAQIVEYPALLETEGLEATERCLNAAAGLLRTALQPNWENAILARLHDGLFVLVADVPPEALEQALARTLRNGRRGFSLSLSRRGSYRVQYCVAPWAAAAAWQTLPALAEP